MTDLVTKALHEAFFQTASPTMFFSGMFQLRPRGIHNSQKVEIDIMRTREDVSVAVTDLSTGYRMNSYDLSTNKEFTPPIHKEAAPLNAADLLQRYPGKNPYESKNFRIEVIDKLFMNMSELDAKVSRAIELQASQIMQTGMVTLTDSSGATVYELDYKPKATHFPTAGTSWASATLVQKLADIRSLCNVIRTNGLVKPDQLVMGETAFENLVQTTGFSDVRFDSRRANLGSIVPMERNGEGGIYRGVIEIGNYALDLWTYDGRYTNPQTLASVEYMDDGKVCVIASQGRKDATFGGIPNFNEIFNAGGARVIPELPRRMTSRAIGRDYHTNIWLSPDGEQIIGGVGTRPLMIPVQIDSFGCLTTQL